MCFVLQIINFHSHNTSLKQNNKLYLDFVLAELHTCIFYNAVSKKNILFIGDNKMWMIHLYILEIFVILQL